MSADPLASTTRGPLREFLADFPLLACGLVALIVLLPASGWGVPFASTPQTIRGWDVDAVTGIGVLAEMSNLANPQHDWYVAYPLAHYLVLAVVYAPYIAFLKVTGGLGVVVGEYPYGLADPIRAFQVLGTLGHLVTVLMASVTVMCVFALGRRIFNTTAGVLAATLVLCCAPFLYYGRTGNLDVPALCWTMLAFVALERAWSDGLTPNRAMACGAFASLAVATKDQSFGVLVLPMLMLLARSVRSPQQPRYLGLPIPAVMVASAILTFAVANGLVIRPERFVRHLQYITDFRNTFTNVQHPTALTVMRDDDVHGRLLLIGDFLRAAAVSVGWPVVITGMVAFVALWRSKIAMRWMLAALLGYFLFVLTPIGHMQYRYAIMPSVLFALTATGLLVSWVKRPPVFAGLAVIMVVPAIAGGAEVSFAMRVDARNAASTWLDAKMVPGDSVGYYGEPHQLPHIPPGVVVVSLFDSTEQRYPRVRPQWVLVAPDYFADSLRERSIFLPLPIYNGLRDESLGWKLAARFESTNLLRRPLPYLPYVNPTVQVYERIPPD